LHRKEAAKLEKKDKHTLFGDGKAHVITDEDFILALEEIEEMEKEREEGVERWKEACAKVKESKVAEKQVWEKALEDWKLEREEWEEECTLLRGAGCRKKDLPKAPKRPKKVDVLAALGEDDEGDQDGTENGDEEDEDNGDENDGRQGSREEDPMTMNKTTRAMLVSAVPFDYDRRHMFASVEPIWNVTVTAITKN
jgi:hypothetical protein